MANNLHAKTTAADLAEQLGASEQEVAAEIADLENRNVIRGYHALVNEDNLHDKPVKAIIEVLPNSEYLTAEKTPGGNLKFHLTTTKSEKEVKDFYDNYFKGLQKVKAKSPTDTSVGYFDKNKRLIIFNLYVWTADGKTNYKMGAEQCDKLENSELFEAVK